MLWQFFYFILSDKQQNRSLKGWDYLTLLGKFDR